MNACEEAVADARTDMVIGQPFFGVLALGLKVEVSHERPTIATDGVRLVVNPDWFLEQRPAVRRGAIAHEVLHCASSHHTRCGDRDHDLWNRACDYAINPMVIAAGFELWKDALNEARFAGMSAETIYDVLAREQPKPGGDGGQKPDQPPQPQPGQAPPPPPDSSTQPDPAPTKPQPGEVLDLPAPDGSQLAASEADRGESERDWQVKVSQANQVAAGAGDDPGKRRDLVRSIMAPRAPWADLLRAWMTSAIRTKTDWSRPNRRHAAAGLFLPSKRKVGLRPIVVAIDTSGSLNLRDQGLFGEQVNAILEDTRPEAVHLVYCDTKIQGSMVYEPDDYPVTISRIGGGGTKFSPVFDWIESEGIEPAGLVYLTDLLCNDWPREVPAFPVLWAVKGPRTAAPFGDVIRVDL